MANMETALRYRDPDTAEPHMTKLTIQQLEKIMCDYCDNTMDSYACQNYIQDNEAVCSECCYCHEEE
jgi:hypothetical protein